MTWDPSKDRAERRARIAALDPAVKAAALYTAQEAERENRRRLADLAEAAQREEFRIISGLLRELTATLAPANHPIATSLARESLDLADLTDEMIEEMTR